MAHMVSKLQNGRCSELVLSFMWIYHTEVMFVWRSFKIWQTLIQVDAFLYGRVDKFTKSSSSFLFSLKQTIIYSASLRIYSN